MQLHGELVQLAHPVENELCHHRKIEGTFSDGSTRCINSPSSDKNHLIQCKVEKWEHSVEQESKQTAPLICHLPQGQQNHSTLYMFSLYRLFLNFYYPRFLPWLWPRSTFCSFFWERWDCAKWLQRAYSTLCEHTSFPNAVVSVMK